MSQRQTVNVFAASRTKNFGKSVENFGDNLMDVLLPRLFGVTVKYVDHKNAELIGVGSIIDAYFRKKKGRPLRLMSKRPWKTLHVWGAGFMHENSHAMWPQKLNFHAVRGPLSAQRIEKPNIPQGDPALFLPQIWPASSLKEYEVGIIPHFVTLPAFLDRYQARLPKNWIVINLLDEPERICKTIAKCDIIISSSLHGLIVADAYNIPSVWIAPETAIKGDGFKFRDYEAQRGVSLGNQEIFEDVLEKGVSQLNLSVAPTNPANLTDLFNAFPFK